MKYSLITDAYDKIESTTKRRGITDCLVKLFRQTPRNMMDRIVYLSQGRL